MTFYLDYSGFISLLIGLAKQMQLTEDSVNASILNNIVMIDSLVL